MKGISSKEIEVISYLELEDKLFFKREDIKKFFKNDNEMNVYIHRLIKKQRILKLNKTKYYLIPVKAYENKWSEHPFIIIDEIFNSKNYYIGGMASAYFYKLIDQIPKQIIVYCKNRQGTQKIFDIIIAYKRRKEVKRYVTKKLRNHSFNIEPKNIAKKWLKE